MLPSNTVGNSYSMGLVLSFVVVATDMPDGVPGLLRGDG